MKMESGGSLADMIDYWITWNGYLQRHWQERLQASSRRNRIHMFFIRFLIFPASFSIVSAFFMTVSERVFSSAFSDLFLQLRGQVVELGRILLRLLKTLLHHLKVARRAFPRRLVIVGWSALWEGAATGASAALDYGLLSERAAV